MTVTNAPTTGPTTDPEVTADQNPGEPTGNEHQDADTFPRAYVETLRNESKSHRERAQTAEASLDTAQRQLFALKVAATGKLASPDDLPYSADLLSDDETLNAAIDQLVTSKPHYAARKPTGSVGQGITSQQEPETSWLGRLKQGV